jgi:hypothetical protein
MKRLPCQFPRALGCVLSVLALTMSPLRAQSTEQFLSLAPGWNAVWLEVSPVYPAGHPFAGQPKAPADVFPAGVVAVVSPKPLAGTAEFFAADPADADTDPAPGGTFNKDGWEQWHNPGLAGDNLKLVTGNRPYLIKTNAQTNFMLAGRVRFHRPTWIPDRFNLVGFGLEGTPTFAQFFAASGGRHGAVLGGKNRIFRLNAANGVWLPVTGATAMVSNQAYWIFSSGPSDYMGPVAVDFDAAVAGQMNFAGPDDAVQVGSGAGAKTLDLEDLVFTYVASDDPTPTPPMVEPTMELVPNLSADPLDADGDLKLFAVRPALDSTGWLETLQLEETPSGSGGSPVGEMVNPLKSKTLTIGAQRTWATGLAGRTILYRLRTGAWSKFWLPVTAVNSSLQLPPDTLQTNAAAVAGLWVGEVSMNAVSSIVVDGAPVLPAAAPAPIRILLHSDDTGTVRLLSQVTIMQTRTADPAIAPVPVLVVDQSKIPFFEGIRERNGKRVGVRLEAVAFDMPREIDPASQTGNPINPADPDLLDMIVAESSSTSTKWLSGAGLYPDRESVDAAAIDGYLLFRQIRPPGLREEYAFSLLMDGAIGAGKTVQTEPGTLVLDPFHRSNPFRHALAPKHAKGVKVTRELSITFDPEATVPGRLGGTFTETLKGVTKSNLILTGTIDLRRVSLVDALDTAP